MALSDGLLWLLATIALLLPEPALWLNASLILPAFWLWTKAESLINAQFRSRHRDTPISTTPRWRPSDVSIIVATIQPEDSFVDSLRLWLINKPLEIIVVTIARDLQLVQALVNQVPHKMGMIKVMTAAQASKRGQLVVGIKAARGQVHALVDDDAFWPTNKVLPNLLAPFADASVGAVCGRQTVTIPELKQRPDGVNMWEVAAMRNCMSCNTAQLTRFAADGGFLCMIGRTIILNAEITKDERFTHAFTNEMWLGNIMNTGDDAFVTRWLIQDGWNFACQDGPDAEIFTSVYNTSKYVQQNERWGRTNIAHGLTLLFFNPGFFKLGRRYPYITYQLVMRLVRPILTLAHIYAWVFAILDGSIWTPVVALLYLHQWYTTCKDFLELYPWVGLYNVLAVLLDDYKWLYIDVYAWTHLGTEGWKTRDDAAEPALGLGDGAQSNSKED